MMAIRSLSIRTADMSKNVGRSARPPPVSKDLSGTDCAMSPLLTCWCPEYQGSWAAVVTSAEALGLV